MFYTLIVCKIVSRADSCLLEQTGISSDAACDYLLSQEDKHSLRDTRARWVRNK